MKAPLVIQPAAACIVGAIVPVKFYQNSTTTVAPTGFHEVEVRSAHISQIDGEKSSNPSPLMTIEADHCGPRRSCVFVE